MTNPTTLADLLEQQTRIVAQAVDEATARLRAERDSMKASYTNALHMLWKFSDKRQRAIRWAWDYRRQARHEHGYARHLKNRIIPELGDDIVALRVALARYGRHEDGCESRFVYWSAPSKRPCTCGLSAVLEGM